MCVRDRENRRKFESGCVTDREIVHGAINNTSNIESVCCRRFVSSEECAEHQSITAHKLGVYTQ